MENFKNKIIVFWARMLLVLLVVTFAGTTVFSVEPMGSISLRCMGKRNEETVCLADDEYRLIQIASAEVSGGVIRYTTLPAFSAYDCDWTELSASQFREKAKLLEIAVKQMQVDGFEGLTDSDGTLLFDRLQPGLYLLIRAGIAPQNVDFSCDPAIYSVPTIDNGVLKYDVLAMPKFRWKDPFKPGGLPQTGQLNYPIPILLLTGLGFFLGGFEMCYGGRRMDDEE